MTQPTADEFFNEYIKGSKEEGKYMKDPSTGLWMIPVKDEEACVASKGFVCKVNGVSMCYYETNWCDMHPVCDNAEDEDETKCAERYKKEFFRKGATFRCQSLQPHSAA